MDIQHPESLPVGWWENDILDALGNALAVRQQLQHSSTDALAQYSMQFSLSEKTLLVHHVITITQARAVTYLKKVSERFTSLTAEDRICRVGEMVRCRMDVQHIGRLMLALSVGGIEGLDVEIRSQQSQRSEMIDQPIELNADNPDRNGWIDLTQQMKQAISRVTDPRLRSLVKMVVLPTLNQYGWKPSKLQAQPSERDAP